MKPTVAAAAFAFAALLAACDSSPEVDAKDAIVGPLTWRKLIEQDF